VDLKLGAAARVQKEHVKNTVTEFIVYSPPFPCLTVVGRERGAGGRDFVYADR
jgi:hypothetical protein